MTKQNTLNIQKIGIILMLGLLVASAFFVRLNNFKKTSPIMLSIDEMVYFRMAKQVKADISDYNTIPYGKELQAKGRDLPSYFSAPLFKHPPVFTYLASFSLWLFGETLSAAVYPTILLGVLMIPLVYLLGSLVSNRFVGMLAAILLWFDPVSTICCQKIWMDAPIAFFMLLSGLFFVLAIKKKKDWYFILSGVASGLAMNTKYSGYLITLAIIFFAIFYHRELFRNWKFLFSLILPILLFLPWVFWTLSVYGIAEISQRSELVHFKNIVAGKTSFVIYGLFAMGFVLLFILNRIRGKDQEESSEDDLEENEEEVTPLTYISLIVPVLFFWFFLRESIFQSFQLGYMPRYSWAQGIFHYDPPVFYFRQLVEFFLVYLFSYISFLIFHSNEDKELSFIRIASVLTILFFIIWGKFQSRYILPSIPFLLILAADMIHKIYKGISQMDSFLPRNLLRIIFVVFLCYMMIKVCNVNMRVSYLNDMCYF